MIWRILILIVFLQLHARISYSASQIELPVVKYQLDNGLTVILQPDSAVPLAVVQIFFNVGSKHEGGGPKGLAHLFEHMMFKGTERYPGRKYDEMVEINGGRNNAFTTRDYTGYYVSVPSPKLEQVLELEADRMVGLQINEASLNAELDVVKEERRMRVENSPMGVAYEKMIGAVYKASQYEWPPIGSMEDIGSIKIEHAEKFYRTYYAPNNATLVIVGDIRVEEAKALVARYFAKLKSAEIPALKWQDPEVRKKPQYLTIKRKVESPVLMIAYPSTPETDPKQAALDLSADILARGPSSRLYKKLVYEKKWATSVQASAMSDMNSGIFLVLVYLRSPKFVKPARELIAGEIQSLKSKLVSTEELNKVKIQSEKDYVDSLKTFMGRARILATYQTVYGDYRKMFSHLTDYQSVSPQSLQSAMKSMGTLNKPVFVEVVSQ